MAYSWIVPSVPCSSKGSNCGNTPLPRSRSRVSDDATSNESEHALPSAINTCCCCSWQGVNTSTPLWHRAKEAGIPPRVVRAEAIGYASRGWGVATNGADEETLPILRHEQHRRVFGVAQKGDQ